MELRAWADLISVSYRRVKQSSSSSYLTRPQRPAGGSRKALICGFVNQTKRLVTLPRLTSALGGRGGERNSKNEEFLRIPDSPRYVQTYTPPSLPPVHKISRAGDFRGDLGERNL